jgi:iron complex transport system ATP-binding protein
MAILTRLSQEQGLTVILSLHELDMAIKCCDIVILVKEGNILSWGSPETTITRESVQSLYQLKNAKFNILTGSTELTNQLPANILVVAGGGTGIPVYRGLTRAGYGFITGILHQNDIDYQISQPMGVTIVESPAFEAIDDRKYSEALEMLAEIEIVIDTGFNIGTMNGKNIELIGAALNLNKKVITLRKNFRQFFSTSGDSVIPVNELPELFTQLRYFL